MFWSAGCSLLRAEGFSCSLDVLYGGLGISKLQFLMQKISSFFQLYCLAIKTLDPDWIGIGSGSGLIVSWSETLNGKWLRIMFLRFCKNISLRIFNIYIWIPEWHLKFVAAGSFPGGPAAGGEPCPTAGGEADPPPPPLQAHGDGAGTQGELQVAAIGFFIYFYLCTDKKENQIFLIHKEIQSEAVAKSYMTNGLLIYGEIFLHFLIY